MTKAELIEVVGKAGAPTRKDSEVIVETVFDSIVQALRQGDKVEIRGFGSFRVRRREGRMGRNPKTGAAVLVPARRVAYFKPSKELRDGINHQAAPADAAQPAPESHA